MTTPAVAGPVDAPWTASGPGTVATPSDGTATAAEMTYDLNPAGFATQSWEFEATAATAATVANPIKVPYTWEGMHAWFQVTTRLDLIVNNTVVQTLEQHGPTSCCASPSNGFIYGGVATFDNVPAGTTYGFRLSGSNGDFNNILRGTLTLSIKPYLDATIGQDNRDWPGAEDVSVGSAPADSRLVKESGEARWFKFAVVPGQDVSVTLKGLTGDDNLPADYDVALYGDIGAAFDQLVNGDELSQLAATSAASGVSDSQVPEYPVETSTIPTAEEPPSGQQFAPRIYAPRIYAPRIYAPRIYAPRIYAPRIYAPRIYAPGSYIPANVSDSSLSDAFSAAQNQVLLAASTNTGNADETVSASTGNTTGFFYVRVQGHGDLDFDATDAFQLTRNTAGNDACIGLQSFPKDYVAPPTPTQQTVIVTDTNALGLAQGTDPYTDYLASLGDLAAATDGLVVDVAESTQVQNLWTQVDGHAGCPQAVNMVADAIKDIVDDLRNDNSKYVVLAGGDDVIPFFRYPDTSGLGPESQFSPPVLENSPSGASLQEDQVQGQDAYGSSTSVTIGGVTVPLPDLAVGRLVKTPAEIQGTVANYLSLGNGTLPEPDSSLVTGYDFLADAADAVNQEFTEALPTDGTTDTLITHPDADPPETPWTGSQLGDALLDSHHDVVYLAGHFSANDTLAADFATTFDADELDPAYVPDPQNAPDVTNADKLKNTLVLSAGCHSGYNIVDSAGVPPGENTPGTNTFDWTQRMAQQKAVLIGGTGYQYGDTDFLEYSERLYLDIARRLHEDTGSTEPIAIGSALMLAKQDYLSSLTALTGIDQKAMLEATLYGLPMTGFDAPRRSVLPTRTSTVTTTAVAAGTPGEAYGLATAELPVATQNTPRDKTVVEGGDSFDLTWLDGADGVTIQPGAPAIPKQIKDVTVAGKVLRGVGFWSGDYEDTTGLLPLTGAPAIEGSTPNSTSWSEHFLPQRLATVNYFGALGDSGRTTLVVNPAQYRGEGDSEDLIPTNTQRNYSDLGMRLFYTPKNLTVPTGQSDPTLAAPPAISEVSGTVLNGVVTFSARVTGDPAAGVQQVWVTWTGLQGGSGHGQWRSIPLIQSENDSTLWTSTLALPTGQPFQGVRFLVQAANGVGAVGLDASEGDGYGVEPAGFVDTASVTAQQGLVSPESPLGVTALVQDAANAPVEGRQVRFTVRRGGLTVYQFEGSTDESGSIALQLPAERTTPPAGDLTVVAQIFTTGGLVKDSDQVSVSFGGGTITPTPSSLVTRAGTQFPTFSVTLTDPLAVAGVPVTFTLPSGAPGATFASGPNTTSPTTATVVTNSLGVATPPAMTAKTTVGSFTLSISAAGAETITVPMAAQYGLAPFISPVSATTTTGATGTTPVKIAALLANGSKLSDAEAAALVQAGRVQIRWREISPTPTTVWSTHSSIVYGYDAKKDFFQADLKASTVGWIKGRTYRVEFRILPAGTVPLQELQGSFDLGSRTFDVTVTK